MKLKEIFLLSAEKGLKIQNEDGSFKPGINGPWNKKDTPLRVTSHWISVFRKAYEITRNKKFYRAGQKSGLWILNKFNRPLNYAFHCCYSNSPFQEVNGLIGQAWVMEGLLEAYKLTKNKRFILIAEDLALKHKFNNKLYLWETLSLEGKSLGIHPTLNQQIWFSLMVLKITKITKNNKLKDEVTCFFSNLTNSFKHNKEIFPMEIRPCLLLYNYEIYNYIYKKYILIRKNKFYNKLRIGYLSFTLYGLGQIYKENKKLIKTNRKLIKLITSSLNYLDNHILNIKNIKNDYLFSYNPTGFEVAFVKNTFKKYLHSIKNNSLLWIKKQLSNNFNFEVGLMNKNTLDKNTLASRIYEVKNLNLNLEII